MRRLLLASLLVVTTGCVSIIRDTTRRSAVPQPSERALKRQRTVEVAPARFAGSTSLTLPLFPDVEVRIVRDELRPTRYGTVWSGRLPGYPAGNATFVIRGEVVVGNIFIGDGRIFELRYGGGGVHVIREIDPAQFGPDADGEPLPPLPPRVDRQADACANTDPASDVDVMIVYTDDARVGAGGRDAIEAEVVLYVESANQTYINSDVAQRLRIVHLSEVDYAESSSSATDLPRLSNPSDTFVDGVHALRDAHGADLVSMIVQNLTGGGNCGRAYIMNPVSTAFENSGFSVVRRFCATSQFSFVHELGHNMSARHEWAGDSTNNAPYTFNHAHADASPTAPATPWRSVMHRGSGCAGCTRVPYFSNPDITYPVGGDPLGIGTGAEPTDNHRTLNQTALTIANLRCSSPGAPNVWMKDTWNDTGAEPDPATASEDMWKSPYIWVRNDEDPTLTQQHVHQNPIKDEENFVYVKLQNGGGPASGDLKVYFADASAGLTWPGSWTEIGTVPVSLAGSSAQIVRGPAWTPTAAGHFCLLARWESASDPMTFVEGPDVGANTRNNNNIAWRNVNVVNLGGDEEIVNEFAMRNPEERALPFSLVVRIPPEQRHSFIEQGVVALRLSESLRAAWKRGGTRSSGIRVDGDELIVTENGASIDGIVLDGFQQDAVRVSFRRKPDTRRTDYQIDFVQQTTGEASPRQYTHAVRPRIIGGVSYDITTRK